MSVKNKSVKFSAKPVLQSSKKSAIKAVAPKVVAHDDLDEIASEANEEAETETEEAAKRRTTHAVKYNPNYFPVSGSKARADLERVVDAGKHGLLCEQFLQTFPILGKFVVNDLVSCSGGRLFATQRTLDILSGKIVLEARGSGIPGFYKLTKLLKAAKTSEERQEIMEQLQKAVESSEDAA